MIGAPQSLKTVFFSLFMPMNLLKLTLCFFKKAVMHNIVVRKFTAGVVRTSGTHAFNRTNLQLYFKAILTTNEGSKL